MAGVEGFEPPTVGFGDRRSTNWNYTPVEEGALYLCIFKGKEVLYQISILPINFVRLIPINRS